MGAQRVRHRACCHGNHLLSGRWRRVGAGGGSGAAAVAKGPGKGTAPWGRRGSVGMLYVHGDVTARQGRHGSAGTSRCCWDFDSSQLRSLCPPQPRWDGGKQGARSAPPPGRAADGGSQGEGSAALLSSPRAVLDVTAAPCRIHEDKSLPPFLCPSASPSVPTLPPSPPAVKAAKEEALRQSPQPSFIFSSSDIKALHGAECGRWRAALCCGCCRQCRTWHGTARHSTAEHSTAEHSTAQHSTLPTLSTCVGHVSAAPGPTWSGRAFWGAN